MELELIIIGLLIVIVLLLLFRPKSTLLSGDTLQDIGGIKTHLNDLKGLFESSKVAIDEIKTTMVHEREIRKEEQKNITQIQRILTDTSMRGRAGEAIIGEALKNFPQGMVEHDFRVKSDVVEFALRFLDGKVMPIDSKFRSTLGIEDLDAIEDIKERREAIETIDKEVVKHVKDVGRKYIDPEKTLPLVIAAIPDSVYAHCVKAHAEAYKHNVVLMPYSMTIPYLLTVYELRVQYAKSIDIERVETALATMDVELRKADETMTNSVYKGLTMIQNGIETIGNAISRVRSHITALVKEPSDVEIKAAEPP